MRALILWLHRRTAEYWRQLATIVFAVIAGLKSIESLSPTNWTWWQSAMTGVLVFLATAGHSYIWREEKRRAPAVVATPEIMAHWNKSWLGEQGYVCIVTRDGSWFLDGESSRLLDEKAGTGNLTVLAAVVTPHISRLRELGACVIDYSSLDWIPRVRFSVLRWGASDATVLIYRQHHGSIEVFERSTSDYPEYWLASDMVELLRRADRLGLLTKSKGTTEPI